MYSSTTILIENGEKSCWMLIETRKRKIESVDCNNDEIVHDSGVREKTFVIDENDDNMNTDNHDSINYGFVKRRKIK
ncbi:hypothetical protein [Pseudoplusia includens SNPV IE]|uniref:Uncharacterized protein n=1 Tax=Pseudoplusia includens SNPV IE TaxID=1592335 RepID=A0A0B4ZZI5_9ABAC|nr:hypothetical protein [Pseudoplusia includens SNPV IE]AJD80778.1 hypothetical protein [Pseudoplusia includens SNPV IE]